MLQDQKSEANKLMRSVIPLMLKLEIPPTPYNYGVWYQYSTEKKTKLNKIIDQHLRELGSLPEFISKELFNEFVIEDHSYSAHGKAPIINKIAADLEHETNQFSQKIQDFKGILNKSIGVIHNSQTPSQLVKVIDYLEKGTNQAHQITDSFNNVLIQANTELAKLKNELHELKKNTELDPITSLSNDKAFEKQLFTWLPDAEDDLTLLFVDIDNLTKINSEHSRRIGTSLIRLMATTIKDRLPDNGFIAHLQAGKFAILINEMERSAALEFAQTLRQTVAALKVRSKEEKVSLEQVTISIGVATILGHENAKDLSKRCTQYLSKAKRAGKNQVYPS